VITISVILGVGILLTAIKLIFSYIRKRLETYIQTNFDKDNIIGATTNANFFGKKSKGGKQIRGNGAFVLTTDEISFIRALPFKEYKIPVKSITEVSLPNAFNGKSVFSKLLCIQYETSSGSDKIAWAIKNPEFWKETIEKLVTADS
jgi:hypothetical protein